MEKLNRGEYVETPNGLARVLEVNTFTMSYSVIITDGVMRHTQSIFTHDELEKYNAAQTPPNARKAS